MPATDTPPPGIESTLNIDCNMDNEHHQLVYSIRLPVSEFAHGEAFNMLATLSVKIVNAAAKILTQ